MKTSFFSQRISGGSTSGGGGPSTGIDVRQGGALVVTGATTLDFSGLAVSGAGTLAAISAVPAPPDLVDSVNEITLTPVADQMVYVLPFDVQDIIEVHVNGVQADFTFAHPRTITLAPLPYTLATTDQVSVSYFP
jgi:hypothetical protein